MVGFITSHVLDTSLGLPAEGIMIELISIKGNKRLLMNSAVTNSDGRLDSPIMEKNKFNKGTYELLFYVKEYFENKHKKLYGIQFHPEVTHTENGKKLISNFIFLVCKIKSNWSSKDQKIQLIKEVKDQVGSEKVICALSGGVDSSVVAQLLNKAIGKKLYCIFVNTGLLRKNEEKQVVETFKKKLKINLIYVNAEKEFIKKLTNISDPEKKRKIIGNLFIKIFERYAKKIKDVQFLAQGTLYPDLIESKSVTGSQTSKIKSHHNVGGLPKKMKLKLVEPLKFLFKDEVRKLGLELNLSKEIISRHPFPGPGLAIRMPGIITKGKIDILKEADHYFIQALKKT